MSFRGWLPSAYEHMLEFYNGKTRPKCSGIIPVYGGNGILEYCDDYNSDGENIIIGRVGAYCGNVNYHIGKVWVSDNAILAKAKAGYDAKFLFYNMQMQHLNKLHIGSSQPLLTQQILKRVTIETPPLQEQKAIAHILSTLDDKIEVNNHINKTLENIAQAIFKRWFVDFEFPNEDGKPYKSSGGEMIESELGLIPKWWKVGSISDMANVIGGATPSKKHEHYYADEGIPWITPKDLSNNKNLFIRRGATDISEAGFSKSSANKMPKGTVLFSSRAPIGYVAIAQNEVTTNQGFKSLIPKVDYSFSTDFIYCWIKEYSHVIENRASGSTFKEVSGMVMKTTKAIIPYPAVLMAFKNSVSEMFRTIANNEKESEILTALRDTLLPKLMSGEIRVPLQRRKNRSENWYKKA